MPNARIEFPRNWNLENILNFTIELDRYSEHDRLIIDFPESQFWAPFAMLCVGSKISYLRRKRPNLQIIFNGWERYPYLDHMGFFSFCGFEHGRDVGEAYGSDKYLPITGLKTNDLVEKDVDKYEEMQDLLQRRVDRIVPILAQHSEHTKVMGDVLSFSIREVFRNVFEHSGCNELYYCAQYWPKSNKVEFAVSDFGVGIRKGLSENPNFRFSDDKEAIEFAMLPSVSGKTHLPRRSETWHNSGYGLYMTSRFARNGGNFVLASQSSAIHLMPKKKNNYVTSFPGTILRVNLDVGAIGDVQNRLREFREEGAKIASEIKGSGNRPPSAMSMLLRRDYKRR